MIVGVIITNGRDECLRRTVAAMRVHLPKLSGLIMVDDTGDETHNAYLRTVYPGFRHIQHGVNQGMAAAVQSGWGAALETPATHIFHLEDDMELIADIPLDDALIALTWEPHLAQMLFQRQPLSPQELEAGSVLGAMGDTVERYGFSEQTHIFSLNPCIIPRRVVELGWPAGPLGVGNESGMTRKLLDAGYSFGVWHGQYVEHIGYERAEAWQL